MRRPLQLHREALFAAPTVLIGLLGLQSLTSIATAILSARWFGPSDRGAIVLVVTTGSLLMLVGSLGVATSGRALLSRGDAAFSLRSYQRFTATNTALQVGIMALVGLPVLVLVGAWTGWSAALAVIAYGAALVPAYMQREGLHGMGRSRTAIATDVGGAMLQLLALVGLYGTGHLTVPSMLWLMAAAVWSQTVMQALLLGRLRTEQQEKGRSYRQLLLLSVPALLASLGQAFVIRGDRIILGGLADTEGVGIYGAAATYSEAVCLAGIAFSQLSFRYSARSELSHLNVVRKLNLLVSTGIAIVGAAAAQVLVPVLLGDSYLAAIPLIYILLPASVCLSAYLVEAGALNGAGSFGLPAKCAAIGAVVLVVGCATTIPFVGSIAAALSSCIAYACMATIAFMRRDTGSQVNHGESQVPGHARGSQTIVRPTTRA